MSRTDRTRSSMRDLIAEAERREIGGAEWMDRASLVRALDELDGSPLGALARARRFFGSVTGLGRVVKVVRGAIDPARPEAPSLVDPRVEREGHTIASTAEQDAPVTLGAVTTAPESIVAPAITVTAEPSAETSETVASEAAPSEAGPSMTAVDVVAPSSVEMFGEAVPATESPRASDLLHADAAFGGLRVVSRGGRSWLVWRAPASRVRAIGRGTELTLRFVSIDCAIGEPDARVVVQTDEESGLALEGVRALPDVSARSCVAAIGVGRGDGFVAVAHARVA